VRGDQGVGREGVGEGRLGTGTAQGGSTEGGVRAEVGDASGEVAQRQAERDRPERVTLAGHAGQHRTVIDDDPSRRS
jgi:hypothetical protein